MNRLFQGMLAFVMTVAAISGVLGKEAKQLTDAESRQIVGASWNYVCEPHGNCECQALPPLLPGQANRCTGATCAAGGVGAACRRCDGGVTIYKTCQFMWLGNCTDSSTPLSCGVQWDGGQCSGPPDNKCVTSPPLSIPVGACNSSNCTL